MVIETIVFHAGTDSTSGKLKTAGGRVLAVTAVADSLETAVEKAYTGVKSIAFKDMYFRKDIAHR